MYIRTRILGYLSEVNVFIKRRWHWFLIIFIFLQSILYFRDLKMVAAPFTNLATLNSTFIGTFFALCVIQLLGIILVSFQYKVIMARELEYFTTLGIPKVLEWKAIMAILVIVNTIIWFYFIVVLLVGVISFKNYFQLLNLVVILINVTLSVLILQKYWLVKYYRILLFCLVLNVIIALLPVFFKLSFNFLFQLFLMPFLIWKLNRINTLTGSLGQQIRFRQFPSIKHRLRVPVWCLIQHHTIFSEYRNQTISRGLIIGLFIYIFWAIRAYGEKIELGVPLLLLSGNISLLILSTMYDFFTKTHKPMMMFYHSMPISKFSIRAKDIRYFLLLSGGVLLLIMLLFLVSGFVGLYECFVVMILWVLCALILSAINFYTTSHVVIISVILTCSAQLLGIYVLDALFLRV